MKYFITIIFACLLFANCGKKIEIQKEEVPVLLVSAKNLSIAAAENSSAQLEVFSNVAWTAASSQDWLKISSTSGTGNSTITVSVTANTTTSARTANITVTGKDLAAQTVAITQNPATGTATLSLSASTLSVAATESNSASFDITTNAAWTAVSNQTWLTVGAASGNGNAKVTLSVSANPTFSDRVALVTVTIAGTTPQTITVTQNPASASLAVSVNALSVVATESNSASFDITTNSAWTAVSNQSWLTVNSSSGNGNAKVSLSATANPTFSDRVALVTVTVAGITPQTVTVTQNPATASLAVSVNTLSVAATASNSASFDITTNAAWTAVSNQTWLTVGTASGNGNAKVTLSVSANPTFTGRIALVTVTVAGIAPQTVSVIQEAGSPNLSVSATSLNIAAAEGSSSNFDITSNTSWTVSSNQTWLTVGTPSGTGNAKVTLTATVNSAYITRTATITVTGQGLTPQTITVTQAANVISVDAKPNWTSVTTDFQYTMTYIAQISISGSVQTIQDGDEVAAFVGTECRGAATIVTAGNAKSFYLLIKGNQTSAEKLTFKYYQKSSSHIFDLNLTKDFVANQAFGSLDVPFVFEVK